MKNQDYNELSLSHYCYYQHRNATSYYSKKIYNQFIIKKALEILEKDDIKSEFNYFRLKNKDIITPIHKESFDILLYKTISNLKESKKRIQYFERNQIINRLLSILKEELPYKVYRLDLKSFYESFSKEYIVERIENINKLSPISKNFIKKIISCSINGIPRGISISGLLSEILMEQFDEFINKNNEVFFYARFVDDIILISHKDIDIIPSLTQELSKIPNLLLNHTKKEIIELDNPNTQKTLSYLGYKLEIKRTNKKTEIDINISDKKIKKIKTRINKSIYSYIKNKSRPGEEKLLIDRINFLAGSYKIYDNKKMIYRNSGIKFNYPKIESESKSLKELDIHLRRIILSKEKRTKNLIRKNLKRETIRKILSISFEKYHKENKFFKFSIDRLSKIKECWKNE